MKSTTGQDFMIARGAPFHQMQRQLGLLNEQSLNSTRRAVYAILLAAGVPLILSLVTAGAGTALAMLTSPAFFSRFIIFVGICFLMEGQLEERVRSFLRRIGDSGLLTDESRARGAEAVTRALRLRDNALAEGICLLLAIGLCVMAIEHQLSVDRHDWLKTGSGETTRLSAAGWWLGTVSSLIFWFLLFRWLWRIAVWGLLLSWIAGLDLRLVATHPDGTGGIGFVTEQPNAFAPLVFGLSCVVGSVVHAQLGAETIDTATYGKLMTIWLAIVLVFFSLPLLPFMRPLGRLKTETLRRADPLATRHQRSVERGVFGTNIIAPEDGAVDGETTDPSAFHKAASRLATMPVSRRALVPLGAAALVPLLLAGATQLPLAALLKSAKGLLII